MNQIRRGDGRLAFFSLHSYRLGQISREVNLQGQKAGTQDPADLSSVLYRKTSDQRTWKGDCVPGQSSHDACILEVVAPETSAVCCLVDSTNTYRAPAMFQAMAPVRGHDPTLLKSAQIVL